VSLSKNFFSPLWGDLGGDCPDGALLLKKEAKQTEKKTNSKKHLH